MRSINEIEVNGNLLVNIIATHAKWINDPNLSGINLCGVDLHSTDLYDANLFGADLSGANLSNANLSGVCLRRADLRNANLSGANLCGADLNRANLRGADLHDANGIMSFGPVGYLGRIGYAVIFDGTTMFALGCHWGDLNNTCAAIVEKYGAGSLYEKQVRLVSEILREKMQDIARVALEVTK